MLPYCFRTAMLARAERSMGRGEGEGYGERKGVVCGQCCRDVARGSVEGKWSPELLAQLAQIPLAEAERGAFPGCPPSSGRKRRFRLVERVRAHKEACSFLLARPSGSGIESFLRLFADGEGLRALETMLGLGLSRMNTLRPAGINLVLRLVHRSLLGIGLRGLSADGAKRYRRLCRDVHPLIVCSGSNTPSLARLFFRRGGWP